MQNFWSFASVCPRSQRRAWVTPPGARSSGQPWDFPPAWGAPKPSGGSLSATTEEAKTLGSQVRGVENEDRLPGVGAGNEDSLDGSMEAIGDNRSHSLIPY